MKIILACLLVLSAVARAQEQSELVTSHVDPTNTPLSRSRIPVGVCTKVIKQGDAIAAEPAGFRKLSQHELLVASDNLRSCATEDGLARADRDLAVGLYGEAIAERSRRERK